MIGNDGRESGKSRYHKKLLDWATEDASSSDAAKSPQRKVGGERSETIIPHRRYSPIPKIT